MSRIVYIGNGTYVNMEAVRRIEMRDGEVIIQLQNGSVMATDIYFLDSVVGKNFIVQIIPAKSVVAIYEGGEPHKKVEFFALCADGKVRGIALFGGEIEFVDMGQEFNGYRHIDMFGNLLEG